MDRDLIDGLDIDLKSAFRNLKSAILLCALPFVLCLPAEAQQPKKIPRIGYLAARNQANDAARVEGVRRGLRELGYTEGQNIAIEYRYGEGKSDRFSELATELVRLKVDAIVVAGGDLLVRAVFNATKTIPVIMTGGGADPVGAGFVKSLARPGGNVTGLTNLVMELAGNGWNCSKKPFPDLSASRLFTIRPARLPERSLKRFCRLWRVHRR